MSLGDTGGVTGFAQANMKVSLNEIDEVKSFTLFSPSVDTAYLGTCTSATANAPVIVKNLYPDFPRNVAYSVTGVAGGMGGTFNLRGVDQFGGTVNESVTIASANGGGTTNGTAIVSRVGTMTFSPAGLGGTAVGTVSIGFGTAAGLTGNWFGLPTKITNATDVRSIVWITTNTPTTLNAGTSIGSLVNATANGTIPQYAFQGTSGVAITDRYVVTYRTTYDNRNKGNVIQF